MLRSPERRGSNEKEVIELKEDLEEQRARADAYLLQLKDGAKYVQSIQDQLDKVCYRMTQYATLKTIFF